MTAWAEWPDSNALKSIKKSNPFSINILYCDTPSISALQEFYIVVDS